MVETVYTCDHCGKKMNDMVDFPDMAFDDLNEYFSADLCRICYMELTRKTMSYCGKQPKEEI